MNLHQLKAIIDAEVEAGNGNLEVMLSQDDEGNGFRPLCEGLYGIGYCNDHDEVIHEDDIYQYEDGELQLKFILG